MRRTKMALSCMWVLPYLSFLRSIRAASEGLQGRDKTGAAGACAKSHAPSMLQINRLDELRDPLVLGDFVRARAQSLDPVRHRWTQAGKPQQSARLARWSAAHGSPVLGL